MTETFFVPDETALAEDTSLLDAGIVDSTGVLEIVDYLERAFGIRLADHEMTPQNLDSIARIAAFVEKKKKGSSRQIVRETIES